MAIEPIFEGLQMNDNDVTPHSKTSSRAARLEASFERFVSVRNTTFLFWSAFALYLLYTSYVPSGTIESRWLIILARTSFLATIGLWMHADGRAHKIDEKWLGYYFLGTVLVPLVVISLPIYLVHSRGWTGTAKSILRFAGYLLLAFVIFGGVVGVLQLFGIYEVGKLPIPF